MAPSEMEEEMNNARVATHVVSFPSRQHRYCACMGDLRVRNPRL